MADSLHPSQVHVELEEIQSPEHGRKFGNLDRRPIDPPAIVRAKFLKTWKDPLSTRVTTSEITDYPHQGLICTVELLYVSPHAPPTTAPPSIDNLTMQENQALSQVMSTQFWTGQRDLLGHNYTSSADMLALNFPGTVYTETEGAYSVESGLKSTPALSDALLEQNIHPPDFNRVQLETSAWMGLEYHTPTQLSTDQTHSLGIAHASSLVPHASGSTVASLPAHKLDYQSHATSPTSVSLSAPSHQERISTDQLFGTAQSQARLVTKQKETMVLFVFGDLAVRQEGRFRLRYKLFDVLSGGLTTPHPVLAMTDGAVFTVWPSREFPGLKSSTE